MMTFREITQFIVEEMVDESAAFLSYEGNAVVYETSFTPPEKVTFRQLKNLERALHEYDASCHYIVYHQVEKDRIEVYVERENHAMIHSFDMSAIEKRPYVNYTAFGVNVEKRDFIHSIRQQILPVFPSYQQVKECIYMCIQEMHIYRLYFATKDVSLRGGEM